MINNVELVKQFFLFGKNDNKFFHCQIVQRAKDHKGEKVKEGAIKTYFIQSEGYLDRVMPEIILLCEHYGARAYINVSEKEFASLQSLLMVKLAEYNHTGTIINPRRCLNSAAGELKSKYPRWIVDIDNVTQKEAIRSKLIELYTIAANNSGYPLPPSLVERKILMEIPTKSGVHLIVEPFNLKAFGEAFPNVDVHKNSMGTLLYYPNSLENEEVD